MPKIESQFKVKHYKGIQGNFIDSDMLTNAYDAGKPHVFEGLMGQIFTSSDRFYGKPLLGMTLAKDKVVEIDNEIYRWRLVGAQEKSLRCVENLEVGNNTPGINRLPFRIKLDEGFVKSPDVLFGESNEFPLEVMNVEADGGAFIYTLRLQTDDMSLFVPPSLLEVGKEFRKVWTSVSSEYNEEYGTTQMGSSFELESQIGYFAQGYTVTDKAIRRDGMLGIGVPVRDKKSGKIGEKEMFMSAFDAKNKDELYMSMEAQLMYGKKSTADGPQGYWKKTGPGLRQQLADGHIEYYNGVLTEDLLRDYLMDIFISRIEEADRKIVVMTGTGGSMLFHDMLAASASSFLTQDTHFIKQISTNPRHLSYGAQFTHYQGPEGIEVTVMKNPMYDDFRYSPQAHPVEKKFPIDSFRFTFLDFGKSEGEDNIQFLRERNSYTHAVVNGTWSPSGPITNGQTTSSLKAGYEVGCTGSAGLWIKDVTRTGELIYDVEL